MWLCCAVPTLRYKLKFTLLKINPIIQMKYFRPGFTFRMCWWSKIVGHAVLSRKKKCTVNTFKLLLA